MLIKDIDWGYGDSDTFMVAYGYPVYRKIRRGKKFYWKLQYIFVMNPALKAEKVGVSDE